MSTTEVLQSMREAVNNGTAKVLTLEIAKTLIGKKIRTIYFGYRGQDGVDEFVVKEVISEWDQAKKDVSETETDRELRLIKSAGVNYVNYLKQSMALVADREINNGGTYIWCNPKDFSFDTPTFVCSDSDRTVFYIVVE